MLESKAKTKWCHHRVRYHPGNDMIYKNRPCSAEHSDMNCIGSNCMMWEKTVNFETSKDKEKPEGKYWQKADATDNPVLWFKEIAAGDCGFKHYSDECKL